MANIGYVQLTRLCNQKCVFCSSPEIDATISINDVVKRIQFFAKNKYIGVVLTGGEPTIHPQIEQIISIAAQAGLQAKLITNGQNTSDEAFLKRLKKAGLSSMNISLQSCREDVHNRLTANPDSFRNIVATLENTRNMGMDVNINTTINSSNCDHLHETVEWLISGNSNIRHFIWNNLDPLMNRATENPDIIATLSGFELSLHLAMKYVASRKRTFRVERVPLCYMADFAHFSTETRKIIKNEERTTFFLDDKKAIRQKSFFYEKAECCEICLTSPVCAGLYEMSKNFYDRTELYPLFIDPETVRRNVMASGD